MATLKKKDVFYCLLLTLLGGFLITLVGCSGSQAITATKTVTTDAITVPLGGNGWKEGKGLGDITDKGIQSWQDSSTSFTAYVQVGQTGNLELWLDGKVIEGKSKLTVSIDNKSHEIIWKASEEQPAYAGSWKITDTGYVAIHIQGISKEGPVFANIENVVLDGSAVEGLVNYVKNNKGNFFYWGHRGPSVHLNYHTPEDVKIEWFYNEVTVPKGEDVLGSYYMADGFSGGYFGMQVNSPDTRHILFSVWSPYKTNDPSEIPDSMRITLLKKGAKVHAGKFGNEGSGGQSYLNYMWKAGNTYKFLLRGVPDGPEHTIYTAYFYAPEEGKWLLIASFRRPKRSSYLGGLYSFLENFSPSQGDKERHVLFGNQWIRTASGKWIALNKATFTTDNTGNKGYRMDFAGGVKNGQFYLKNCGFFSQYTKPYTQLERAEKSEHPKIDFEALP
ncbi:MAG TPA: DUF3472 domain-containing protein [Chitinophagaceae bacterium]|nr:DUF3472 domain-containing protein [Chitinophagaceae bacterium]